MCGRFTYLYRWRELYKLLNLLAQPPEQELLPSYNVAPTQSVPVYCPAAANQISTMTWGLIPAWAKDGTAPVINARSETASGSPVFRGGFARRRCVVPVSGFYEWKQTLSGKQPMYIRLLNDPLFFLAGIAEQGPAWAGRKDGFAILTTRPNTLMETVHTRMPVIVRADQVGQWLGENPPTAELFEPFPSEEMEAFPVSAKVNSPRNNDPSLIERDNPPPASLWG